MSKQERMYVFPKFKKLVKQEANEEGKTVMEWTKKFTQEQDPFKKLEERIKKKKTGGGLDFV